ncbi:MAG: potassium channel family protein, partial [Halanaeroarchaeum sp.]
SERRSGPRDGPGTDSSAAGGGTDSSTGGDGPEAPGRGERGVDGAGATRAPTTTGGRGRLTLAARPGDAASLLSATSPRVVVRSRGLHREFELVALLRQSGRTIEQYEIGSDSQIAGLRLGEADPRGDYGVVILAIRREGSWRIAPDQDEPLDAGTSIFVTGSRGALNDFEEVAT